MNGLDLLRWILLIVGAAILIGVYVAGRRSLGARLRRRREERAELPEIESEAGTESLTVPDPELAELGRSIVLEEHDRPEAVEPEPGVSLKAERPRAQPEAPKPEPKIVVVYVVARPGLNFRGPDIFDAARDAGLEYGEMRIFHHYESVDGQPQSVFSLASMVEPGWFDEAERDTLQTPGLALFLQLPGPMDGVMAFDAMIAAAQHLKHALGGELHDASRSVIGQQTIAHLREQVGEYERHRHARSGTGR